MRNLILLAVLASALAPTAQAQTDTTVDVTRGVRLKMNNFGGSITVHTWARNAVRVQADHSERDRIELDLSSSTLTIRGGSRRMAPRSFDYELTVPAWMALELSGVSTDITVEGTQGEVSAESVEGAVSIRGGTGFVSAQSVDGDVTIEGAQGRIEANTVDGQIHITNVTGEIYAATVDGDVLLERIESANVEAQTVDGNLDYQGAIKDGGHYHLASHSGDVTLRISDRISATVSVSTFSGEFESDFPVQLTGTKKRRFTFTLGGGSARVDLESFDGTTALRRAGGRTN